MGERLVGERVNVILTYIGHACGGTSGRNSGLGQVVCLNDRNQEWPGTEGSPSMLLWADNTM
jgi:hypothetical protein